MEELQNGTKWNEWNSGTRIKPLMFAATDRQTATGTHTRPWSILWPDGDLTAQQLLAVWCFTLRITFHFQTPQPIRGKQGRQWQRDATLALLILRPATKQTLPSMSHKHAPGLHQNSPPAWTNLQGGCIWHSVGKKTTTLFITANISKHCTHQCLWVSSKMIYDKGPVCTSRVDWKWCIEKSVHVFAADGGRLDGRPSGVTTWSHHTTVCKTLPCAVAHTLLLYLFKSLYKF